MKTAHGWLTASMAALSCVQAQAQFSPPPTTPPAPAPAWKGPATPAARPGNPGDPNVNAAPRPKVATDPLKDLPYESLVKRDAAGKLIPLKDPIHHAALKNNPTIEAADRKRLAPFLASRQAGIDRVAIDNLDVLEKIEGGALDNLKVDPADSRAYLKSIIDYTKPLRPPENDLSSDLRQSGQISIEQFKWSLKLWQEYNRAAFEELRAANDPKNPNPMYLSKYTELQNIEETLQAYPRMLVEASKSLDKTVPQLGLSEETLKKIAPAMKALAGNVPDDKRLEQMRAMVKDLTLAQRQELLRKTVALRPPLAPIEPPPNPVQKPASTAPAHPAAPVAPPPAKK